MNQRPLGLLANCSRYLGSMASLRGGEADGHLRRPGHVHRSGEADHQGLAKRLDAARTVLGQLGGELTSSYLTVGPYDLVAILEAPNDDLVAKFALAVGSQGNVHTTSLKAFPEAEYRRLITGST